MSLKNIFKIMIIAIIVITVWFFYGIYFRIGENMTAKNFIIIKGEETSTIADNLKKEDIIKSSFLFKVYLKFKGVANRVKAGEYQLPQNLTIEDLVKILVQGVSLEEQKITIVEGLGAGDIATYLMDKKVINQKNDFLKLLDISDWKGKYNFFTGAPKTANLEGYLFPDTYNIYIDATAEEIIEKILQNFNGKITQQMRVDIDKQGKNLYDILIMASVIEKEVSKPADRKMVADIFYKRLEAGIPLQSDATVNYVTKKGTTRPSIEDTKVDSLYNTYKYKGLPPGPINNPGLEAISAAIYPTSNPYYYFLTDEKGQIYYAKTYEQHLLNKQKYLN